MQHLLASETKINDFLDVRLTHLVVEYIFPGGYANNPNVGPRPCRFTYLCAKEPLNLGSVATNAGLSVFIIAVNPGWKLS